MASEDVLICLCLGDREIAMQECQLGRCDSSSVAAGLDGRLIQPALIGSM